MSERVIRAAEPADAEQILEFIIELAVYEKAEQEVKTDADEIRSRLFAEQAAVHALIVEVDGQPAGYAVYFLNFSTWLGCYGIFLEDLYITPAMRGHGHGKALLRYLARQAVTNGYGRFEWNVLDWNTPAIEFYESIGARPQSEWVGYRLTGEALAQFAAD